MQDFEYAAVKTIDEALSLLQSNGEKACILSGGTDLLVQLREGRKSTSFVVDIKQIPEVNQLVFDQQQGMIIGAAVPCLRICTDPLFASRYPGLVDALSLIGGTQIQGRASIGGNLCNASPAADSIPALITHHALAVIAGPEGFREMPVEKFCLGPGRTVLGPKELLVSVRIPPLPAGFGAGYLRFIPRNEMDIAVVGAGVSVVLNDEKTHFTSARIALGAVAPTPLLVQKAGDSLAGKPVSSEIVQSAASLAGQAAQPISDMRGTIEQRRHLVQVLTRRALNIAIERAKGFHG